MVTPLVCILDSGDWDETNRAVASARRFGLAVAIGTSTRELRGTPHPDAHRFAIEWRNDFADARNQLAALLAAGDLPGEYLLWLDSDEELVAFPGDGGEFDGPCLAVAIVDRADLTPRAITRLQRRSPLDRWANAIHETLPSGGLDPPIVGSIRIHHHGYEDHARVAEKRRRNRRIVELQRAAGHDYFTLALEEARAASGAAAFMAWLRAFNHPEGRPKVPGGFDARYEPAKELCSFDFCKPALEILRANPRIVAVELAVLSSEQRVHGRVDEARLARVAQLIARGDSDPHYSYPRALEGAGRDDILAWIAKARTVAASAERGK